MSRPAESDRAAPERGRAPGTRGIDRPAPERLRARHDAPQPPSEAAPSPAPTKQRHDQRRSAMTPTFDLQGHRGARGLLPENTIPAFLLAVELGVTTVELDVVVTRDRRLVASHDPWFDPRICSPPDGRPVAEADRERLAIYRLDYDDVAAFDCGRRGHPDSRGSGRSPCPSRSSRTPSARSRHASGSWAARRSGTTSRRRAGRNGTARSRRRRRSSCGCCTTSSRPWECWRGRSCSRSTCGRCRCSGRWIRAWRRRCWWKRGTARR